MHAPAPYHTGEPAWVDLATAEADQARRFYSALFGWEIVDEPFGDLTYGTCLLDGQPVAGISPPSTMDTSDDIGWTTYFAIDAIDVAGHQATALGGRIVTPPRRFPAAGYASVIADPQGAVFGLYQAVRRHGTHVLNAPGALCWNELNTPDPQAAVAFYRALFGYTARPLTSPTGAAYSLLLVDGRPTAGMLALESDWPTVLPARWLTYFAVADLDRTAHRVAELGGSVTLGPLDTPYGALAVVRDPGRAVFCLARLDSALRPIRTDDSTVDEGGPA